MLLTEDLVAALEQVYLWVVEGGVGLHVGISVVWVAAVHDEELLHRVVKLTASKLRMGSGVISTVVRVAFGQIKSNTEFEHFPA